MGSNWAIMDSTGIIESGSEAEMREKFINSSEEIEDWDGDLLLIEIHEITR